MISICTPTFNREYTLTRLYESLKNQNVQNFEWIVIDDGSTDKTRELIENFQKENLFTIKYKFQKNQGKHIALNEGQNLASKALFVCLDSDDWFTEHATEVISNNYKDIIDDKKICGMILLDKFKNGQIIGTDLPDKKIVNWIELIHVHNMKGDKCYIFKTEYIKKIKFPNFKKNNHMPPSYQMYLISESYQMLCVNEAIKYVEYMPDGISQNIVKKYFSAPENYTYYRKSIHNLLPTVKLRIKNSIHYNITNIISSKNEDLKVSGIKQRFTNYVAFPISLLLFSYLKIKKKW